jgi:hypothetical protein
MSAAVDWDAAVARFYNTGESEWDQALGPSPKQAGCRVPAHVLRAYGYSQSSGTGAPPVRPAVSNKRPPNGAVAGADTALGGGAAPTSKVLTPPITLSKTDAWLRQVLGDGKLPPSVTKVAVSIFLHLNRQTGMAWPAIPTIAQETAMTKRTVHNALNSLQNGGHLARRRGGGSTSNRYQLMLRTELVKQGAPVKEITPVKPASFISEAGFIWPVKDASPEPPTEPPSEPHNAQRRLHVTPPGRWNVTAVWSVGGGRMEPSGKDGKVSLAAPGHDASKSRTAL